MLDALGPPRLITSVRPDSHAMEKIILFAIPMAATVPVTVLLCHIRIARKLRISFGTVLFCALLVTFCWFGFISRGQIYTVGFWDGSRSKGPDRGLVLKHIAFTIVTCALPALYVVHCYQRDAKRGDHVA